MITDNIINLIKKHEGLNLSVYKDTLGVSTVGYGHALHYDESFSNSITQEEADSLLLSDLKCAAVDALSLFPNISELCEARQAVLVDMCYNLGREKLSHFVNMIAAVLDEKWTQAAWEMRSSKWFSQVGDRGLEDWNMMISGDFQ